MYKKSDNEIMRVSSLVKLKKFIMRIKYSMIFIVLFGIFAQAQEKYKTAEGFYDLSSFEVASGIYLLENKTFFYYSSFGNVDLKIFGIYNISEQHILSLQVDKSLMKEFYVYGLNNEMLSDSMSLYYEKPYNERAEKIFIITDNIRKDFPEFDQENTRISISLKKPKSKTLKIGFINPENHYGVEEEKSVEVQLLNDTNEIKIYHNYYAEMTIEISKMILTSENGTLTSNNFNDAENVKKEEISEHSKNELMTYIDNVQSRDYIVKDELVYKEL